MENKNHNHSGFGNGFLLGLLIGIIATLLLTTKRGREILHDFTEKGLSRVSDIEKKLEKKASEAVSKLEEIDDESEYLSPEQPKEVRQVTKLQQENSSQKPTRHRFFRTTKKAN